MVTEYKLSYTAQEIDEKLGMVNDAVTYVPQTLTEEQKAQARINIGALSNLDLQEHLDPIFESMENYVSHHAPQNLAEEQKAQAQENIGLIGKATTNPIASDESRLGEELIAANGTGWTLDGWTGNLANGFTHTVGSTGRLTYTLGDTGTKVYYLEFDVTSPTGAGSPNASTAFTVTIGNSPRFITYDGGGSKHYAFGIRSVENGNLEVIPTDVDDPNTNAGTFNGTISNISLREVVDYAEPTFLLQDKNGTVLEEKRLVHGSTYVGMNSGRNAFAGAELNTAVGNDALRENTTGYWNTAVGSTALRDNTVGSRNVAIGKMALEANVTGDRNIAIGPYALCRNTTGRNNVAIGADSVWHNTTGENNIGIGLSSLCKNASGSGNISIGRATNSVDTAGNYNVSIGYYAMCDSDGDNTNNNDTNSNNIAIGYRTLAKNKGVNNVAIGAVAMTTNTTGYNNLAIGSLALTKNTTGRNNVAVGYNAGKSATTAIYNTFIGGNCAEKITTGNQNVVIGNQAGNTVTTGGNNVLIGFLANTIAGASNSIAIGKGATATKSNSAVIGDDSITETLLKGNLIVRGTDGVKRQIVFNEDGTVGWATVE